jgi:hypothetical protein
VEGQDESSHRRFGRPVGSADLRWALMVVPGAHMDLRRFGRVGGPWDPCDAHMVASYLSGLLPMDY